MIHLAAIVGGIANFHKLPFTLTEVNHALYNGVFRAALEEGVERFTYVSSSMVFERAEQFPTTEEYLPDCPPPRSAYGWSKLAGEVYCRAAHDEHGLPFTICRPFNAYGPGEMPEDEPGIAHAVPDLLRKSLAGLQPLPIFGSGEQTRTLTHVDDIADGIVTATAHPAGLNQDFNISAADELTVAAIARICWEAAGNDADDFELEHLPTSTSTCSAAGPRSRRPNGYSAGVRGSACTRGSPRPPSGCAPSASTTRSCCASVMSANSGSVIARAAYASVTGSAARAVGVDREAVRGRVVHARLHAALRHRLAHGVAIAVDDDGEDVQRARRRRHDALDRRQLARGSGRRARRGARSRRRAAPGAPWRAPPAARRCGS